MPKKAKKKKRRLSMQSKNNIFKIAIWAFALAVIYLTVGVIVSYVILEQIAQSYQCDAHAFSANGIKRLCLFSISFAL